MAARAKADVADDDVAADFRRLVNMTAHALSTWLATDESKSVGIRPFEGRESTGHASGRHIVRILEKHVSERTESDVREMHRVVGYIKRHLALARWAYWAVIGLHAPQTPKPKVGETEIVLRTLIPS